MALSSLFFSSRSKKTQIFYNSLISCETTVSQSDETVQIESTSPSRQQQH